MFSTTMQHHRRVAVTVVAAAALLVPGVASGQDLRSPDAVSAGIVTTDLRSPDAVAAGIVTTDLRSPDAVAAGIPTSAPVPVVADGGTDWNTYVGYVLGLIALLVTAFLVTRRLGGVHRPGTHPSA